MRRVIISPAQLKMINEAVMYNVDTSMAGIGTAYAAAKDKPEAKNGINFHITDSPVNTSNGEESTAIATNPEDLTDAADRYNNIRMPGQQNESRFSKRQVELGRLLEMRKNGKVFSKRQLNEMFMETQENAERLRRQIGGCRLYDIFDAIEEVFPEELENAKNVVRSGADLPEFLCSVFSKEGIDSDREEEFLDMLGI